MEQQQEIENCVAEVLDVFTFANLMLKNLTKVVVDHGLVALVPLLIEFKELIINLENRFELLMAEFDESLGDNIYMMEIAGNENGYIEALDYATENNILLESELAGNVSTDADEVSSIDDDFVNSSEEDN